MSSLVKNLVKTLPIGNLYNDLQTFEKDKGQVKQLEIEIDAIKTRFLDAAQRQDADFVSESAQRLLSVRIQARKTLSAEKLLASGVSQTVLDACTSESQFAVLRVH
jgi:hypothetical protein